MRGSGDLVATIAKIYEASIESESLDRLAGIVAAAVGSRSGFLALLDRPQNGQVGTPAVVGLPSATENFDEWARAAYAEHYHQCNIWFHRGIQKGFPAIVLGHELVAPEMLVRSEWYEYCRRLDAFHVLGAQFHLNSRLSAQFGAHRPRHSKPFDEGHRRIMSLLLPHLQRALQVNARLGLLDQICTITSDLLERVGLGVLILDRDRRLLFANLLAERMLAGKSFLDARNGRVFASPGTAPGFDHMVEQAAQTSAGMGIHSGGMLNVAGEEGIVRLLISPLARERSLCQGADAAVLVLLTGPAPAPPRAAEKLSEAFGLTRAEGQLLSALVAGEPLSEYADRLGLSIETPRTHLKRILNKTGIHRQVDLVRIVSSDLLFQMGPGASNE